MTFFKTLQKSIGKLIRLKTQLYWYDGRGWDNNPGRVCLILDIVKREDGGIPDADRWVDRNRGLGRGDIVSALLLIDGSPKWVTVDEQSIELLTSEPI